MSSADLIDRAGEIREGEEFDVARLKEYEEAGLELVEIDDDGGFPPGCSRIEDELEPGAYRVRIRHPDGQALPEHRVYFDLQPVP